jgi:hypothetical protein
VSVGISDTLALGILCEGYGMYLNSAQVPPAYRRSLGELREMGVLVGSYGPHSPAQGRRWC